MMETFTGRYLFGLCLFLLPYFVTAETYYVRQDSDTLCPPEGSCLTISEYAAKPPDYFSADATILVFLRGEHVLSNRFILHDINELLITKSSPEAEVVLSCLNDGNFKIMGIRNATISGVRFSGCYGNDVSAVDWFLLEHSLVHGGHRNNVSGQVSFSFTKTQEITVHNCSFVLKEVAQDSSLLTCAALRADRSTLIVQDSLFENNSAISASDSSVMCFLASNVTMTDCTFINNSAQTGGVIYAENSNVSAYGSLFVGNHANQKGGVAWVVSMSSFTLEGCTFSENSCSGDGGAIFISNNSELSANHCQFQHNTAVNGGVIVMARNSTAAINNSSFISNIANNSGVISSYLYTVIYLNDTNFSDNKALSPSLDHGYGAVLNTENVQIHITKCKFQNNSASTSGGCGHISSASGVHIHGYSIFENNSAIYGGAFTIARLSTLGINEGRDTCESMTVFLGNTAEHGGALNILESSVAHIQCARFEHNMANRCSKPNDCRGGAILARTNTSVNLIDLNFYGNTALGHGGVIFAQFSSIESRGQLRMDGNNGTSGIVYVTSCTANVVGNSTFSNNNGSFLAHNSHITFGGETRFYGGMSYASEEGGAITAVRSRVDLHDLVILESNKALYYGGALLATESTIESNGTCVFTENSAEKGGALYAYKTTTLFEGDTHFFDNSAKADGGGIFALETSLQYYSEGNAFVNNQASRGGAIYFDQTSSLSVVKEMMECPQSENVWYCENNTSKWLTLTFTGNSASERGGAMYVNDNDSDSCEATPFQDNSTYKQCFIQGIAAYESANDWEPAGVNFANIYFANNSAPHGPLLHGGLLDRCAIENFSEQKQILQTGPFMYPLIYFANMSNDSFSCSEIDSDPIRVCFCDGDDNMVNCGLHPPLKEITSGRMFSLSVAIVNQVNKSVNGSILAYLSSESSRLGSDQAKQLVTDTCTTVNYTIFSADPACTLFLYADGPCSDHGISRTELDVNIDTSCPVGFVLSRSSLQCECDPKIQNYITNCSIDTQSVIREGSFWISSVQVDDNVTDFVIHDYCPYDYCFPSTQRVEIDLNDFENGSNAQCASDRSGRLCGSCLPGYSMTLGSSKCMVCSNYWLLLVIPFCLAGIGLVLLLIVCNLTLAAGTINGLLFYANILIANRTVYFPFQVQNVLTVFVSWLGLNLGIATCFFDGMDGFSKMWVQVSFELYLIFLTAVIVKLGKSVRVTSFFHKHHLNPVNTLATLLMLSYEKLSRKIFSFLSYTELKYPNNTVSVWLFDPTYNYLSGRHISLAIVAAIILITGIFFNFVLLFSKVVISRSKSVYIHSFLEAFHAPFKPNHKYWAGLLLLIRNISYFISEFLNAGKNPEFNLNFIFALVLGILLIKLVFVANLPDFFRRGYAKLKGQEEESKTRKISGIVYENPVLDLLETSFLINLLVLTYFTLYIRGSGTGDQGVLFYVSSSVVLVTFVGILLYHTFTYTNTFSFVKKFKTRRDSDSINYVCYDK